MASPLDLPLPLELVPRNSRIDPATTGPPPNSRIDPATTGPAGPAGIPTSHSFILSFFHSFILSFFHSFILSFFHSFILSFFHVFFEGRSRMLTGREGGGRERARKTWNGPGRRRGFERKR